MNLPEQFEVNDVVIWTSEKRQQLQIWTNTPFSGLYIVKAVDWGRETLKLKHRNDVWYSFLDFTILKKNCPIVKLLN